MLDRDRLLHRLPQFSKKRSAKRGRSRSQSRSRPNSRRRVSQIPTPKVIHVEIIRDIVKSVSTGAVVKDKISPSHPSISSTDDNLQMDLGVDEVSPPSHDDAEPIPEPSRASDEVECRIPPVIIKKGGRTVVYSYDEYLERQFTKDSSDDENFQFEVPKDLLESFLD